MCTVTATEVIGVLAGMPLFRGMATAHLEEIANASHEMQAQKGEQIFRDGKRPKAFFHVLSGQVKLAISSDEGDEKIIEIYSRGDSFGLAELFGTAPGWSFAQAATPTVLLQIGKHALSATMKREPLLYSRIVTTLADRASALERDIAAYCFHSARRRTLDFLLRQAGSGHGRKGKTTVELGMRKQLIAARLGLTPESLSRALRDLTAAGLISVRGMHVTLQDALLSGLTVTAPGAQDEVPPEHGNRHRTDALLTGLCSTDSSAPEPGSRRCAKLS